MRTKQNDTANAAILVDAAASDFVYVPETRRWMHWNGRIWVREPDEGAIEFTAQSLLDLESRRDIANCVALARIHPDMRIILDLLDTNGYELNTIDGIVDLTTGLLWPHNRNSYHTKITGCGFDTSLEPHPSSGRDLCPQWDAFLNTTFEGNGELIAYVQRLLGYAAIGKVTHSVLPFLHGGGANGKTVLLETVSKVLGDYAIAAPSDFLLANHSEHPTEIARLQGARFVVCSEINQGSKFDEAKVKLLTGGDRLVGRFMRQDYGTAFEPTHTLFLMGNHQPSVGAGGHAFWRRLRLLPFNHQMPEHEQVDGLAEKLFADEGPTILRWIVRGAVDVITHGGLGAPECVTVATREYERSEDSIAEFIAECCQRVTAEFKCPSGEVYRRYADWCRANGIPAKAHTVFGRELASHGVKVARSHGKNLVYGLMLLAED